MPEAKKPLFDEDDLGRKVLNKEDRDLLRSILEKENAQINKEIADAKGEVVFGVAYEGGGFEITRFTTRDGKAYFRNSGSNMTFDENDDEDWPSWESGPYVSFEGAFGQLQIGTELLCLRPRTVHPDYVDVVSEYGQKLLDGITSEERRRYRDRVPRDIDEWLSRVKN